MVRYTSCKTLAGGGTGKGIPCSEDRGMKINLPFRLRADHFSRLVF
jgi:hypothetical protein